MDTALLERAYRLIARRPVFEADLRRALARHGSPEEVDEVVAHVRRRGILDDQEAASAYVRPRSGRRAIGDERIAAELDQRGVEGETADHVQQLAGDEGARARAVLDGRKDLTRVKAGRLLGSRGFSEDTILSVLDERFPLDD